MRKLVLQALLAFVFGSISTMAWLVLRDAFAADQAGSAVLYLLIAAPAFLVFSVLRKKLIAESPRDA